MILVAHSIGACVVRVYAHRFPEDVAGLVLVDPMVPEEFSPQPFSARVWLWRAAFFSHLTGAAAAFGLVRLGLWGLLRRGAGNPGALLGLSGTLRRIASELGKLPPDVLPALRAHWSQPRFFRQLAASILSLPACADEALRQPVPAHIPVVVLSGAHQPAQTLAAHRAIATRHIIVDGSAHWIQLDRPALVADAVRALAAPVDARP